MKIDIGSDIHLEFGTFLPTNKNQSDVLVLAGDICQSINLRKFFRFFEWASSEYPWVVYVPGNHEHYDSDFFETTNSIRENLREFKNIFVLDKTGVILDDCIFYGGTLWTDYNKNDPVTIESAPRMMNDYVMTKNLNTLNALRAHNHFMSSYDPFQERNADKKAIVVSHHSPSFKSVGERFIGDTVANGFFCSDLSEFILDRPSIKCWIHGHTHDKFDYNIGETRVICNPRGYYPYEPGSRTYTLMTVEV